MKRFVILTLCVCLALCVLAACNGEDTDIYVSPTEEISDTSATESQTESESETESESKTESGSQTPEQTMGSIQEMIPKTD